jgi:hypothetical protein
MSRLQTSLNTPILATGTGTNSVLLGHGTIASGNSAIAIGGNAGSSGSGDFSISLGSNAQAAGTESISIGLSSTASSINSIAIGPTAVAVGGNSAITIGAGAGSSGSGNESIVIGVASNASGDFSTVIGINSNAGTSGQQNIWTLGHNATNTTPGSMLLGGNTGSTPLKLIWNDQTADLGTIANTFGTLYTDNIVPTLRTRNSNFTPVAGASYFISSVLSPLIITLPTTPNFGDTYFMTTTTSSYKIQTQTSGTVQVIYYNNTAYDNDITTSTVGATISIICLQFTPGSPSSSIFVVTSTSPGAIFTGT